MGGGVYRRLAVTVVADLNVIFAEITGISSTGHPSLSPHRVSQNIHGVKTENVCNRGRANISGVKTCYVYNPTPLSVCRLGRKKPWILFIYIYIYIYSEENIEKNDTNEFNYD